MNKLDNISKSQDKIAKETSKNTFSREYNITYVSLTLIFSLGVFVGAIILYFYLFDINAINLFPSSITNTNLLTLTILYTIYNIILYVLIILPSLMLSTNIKNKKEISSKLALGYAIPSITPILVFSLYFIPIQLQSDDIFLFMLLVIVVVGLIFNKIAKLDIITSLFYFIILTVHMFYITLLLNDGKNDLFYFFYPTILFLITWISNYLTIRRIERSQELNTKLVIFDYTLILFSVIVIIPFLTMIMLKLTNQDKNIETTNTYKIIKAFGYADKSHKAYFIENQFIEMVLTPKTESILTVNLNKKKYQKYTAFCGKIYWNSSNMVVFKEAFSDQYVQIPVDKIFEHQGKNTVCFSAKHRNILTNMQKSPFNFDNYINL